MDLLYSLEDRHCYVDFEICCSYKAELGRSNKTSTGPLYSTWDVTRDETGLNNTVALFRPKFELSTGYVDDDARLPAWLREVDSTVFTNKTVDLRIYPKHDFTWTVGEKLEETICPESKAQGDTETCPTTVYRQTQLKRWVPALLEHTDVPEFRCVKYEFAFEEFTVQNHPIHQVVLECCRNSDSNYTGAYRSEEGMVSACSESACIAPPKSPTAPELLLSVAWKAALTDFVSITRRLDERAYTDGVTAHFGLAIGGFANRTARNLIEFFNSRTNNNGPFLTMVLQQHLDVLPLPNGLWTVDEFMTIIETSTREFSIQRTGGRPGVLLSESLLSAIAERKRLQWREPEPTRVFNAMHWDTLSRADNNFVKCIQEHANELMDGLDCGDAMDAASMIITTLREDYDETFHDNMQGFVYISGFTIVTLLLLQTLLRFQRLPGGRLVKRDQERWKRRNVQLRMALEDDYLRRDMSFRATQQLGEAGAREALDLLETAARREPTTLPRNYQFKQRQFSRWFVLGGHVLATLSVPLLDFGMYVWLECVLLLINLMQSMLEIKACNLVCAEEDSTTASLELREIQMPNTTDEPNTTEK